MILAIDFDGVLCDNNNVRPGFTMGAPMEGAIEAMRTLKRQGDTLIIHTVRGGRPQHVEDWLRHFGIPYDDITNIKPNAACFIDNNAIRFTSWSQVMQYL